jgi:hypothetical protein
MSTIEPAAEPLLEHDLADAKWVWQEAARVYGMHYELAHLYRAKSDDRRTITRLWELIEEGEYALRVVGVEL